MLSSGCSLSLLCVSSDRKSRRRVERRSGIFAGVSHSVLAFMMCFLSRQSCMSVSVAIIPLGRCNERAVFSSISGAVRNEEWQRRNHCCGALLLCAVFLSIYLI